MARNLRQTENEIRKGVNLEENIPVYITAMASLYGEFAFYNLAMNLSLIIDKSDEDGTGFDKHNKEIFDALVGNIRIATADAFDPDAYRKATEETIALRETIRLRVEALTGYMDRFVIHQDILRRLEPSFERIDIESTSNDDLAREILRWIFLSGDDDVVINERIRRTCCSLPVRLTKNKIIDMVDGTFSLYNGSDKTAIDNFDYMLRTSTGLFKPDPKADIYENVKELLDELDKADHTALSEQHYFELKDDVRLGTSVTDELADELTDLMGVANALLTVLLTRQYFSTEAETKVKRSIDMVREMLSGNTDADALFEGTEGYVEELAEKIKDEESVLLVIEGNYMKTVSNLMLGTPFERLLICTKLCSDSVFARLQDDNEKTSDEYHSQVRTTFARDLSELFKNGNKLKNRAVMAQLLGELPIMLTSRAEVTEYVKNALTSCRDAGERQVAINLIREYYD
ncbi:MAG: hypothetical protein IKS11_10750 [Lachnospiraceae bacterium]|nr:hypothetical protein [Lachnospiraceae bacterium]